MIRVVLVRPNGPRNVGAVVRAAANFGPVEIFLVAPERPSLLIHPDFVQMSHGVEDMAQRCRVVATLEQALADCEYAVGFTARRRGHRPLTDWREAREGVVARSREPGRRTALVFGNEVTGLSGADCMPLQELLRIPTSDEHGSLNLAMSVVVVLSTLFLAHAPSAESPGGTPVQGDARQYLMLHAREVLGSVARSESARQDIEQSVERVFSRAELETRDARAWHAVLRALGSRKTPMDYDLGPAPRDARRNEALSRALESGDAEDAASGEGPAGEAGQSGGRGEAE